MLSRATNRLKSSYLFLGEAKMINCHRHFRAFLLVALRFATDTKDEAFDGVVYTGQPFTIRHLGMRVVVGRIVFGAFNVLSSQPKHYECRK